MKNCLLQFAYHKEAEHFLKYFHASVVKSSDLELFVNPQNNVFILITKEGPLESLTTTIKALSFIKYSLDISLDKIINLGIAGSLTDDIKTSQLISPTLAIRSDTQNQASFQSFELIPITLENFVHHKTFTNITADKRINNRTDRQALSIFGSTVDRELWGVAKAAFEFKIPVSSFKLISDNADAEVCRDLLTLKDQLSLELFQKSRPIIDAILENKISAKTSINEYAIQCLQNPLFYFTQSQKHILKKLYLGLKISSIEHENNLFSDIYICQLLEKDTTPKKRSSELLWYLHEKLNPYLARHKKELSSVLVPLIHQQIYYELDPKLENTELAIHLYLNSEEDFEEIKRRLQNFNFTKFKNLLDGN